MPDTDLSTQQKADRYLGYVLKALDATLDEDGEFLADLENGIDSSYVYSHETGKWERFMLAGNGPTVYAYFLFDEEGDIDHGYVEYCDIYGNALAVVPRHLEDALLMALRHSVATGIERLDRR